MGEGTRGSSGKSGEASCAPPAGPGARRPDRKRNIDIFLGHRSDRTLFTDRQNAIFAQCNADGLLKVSTPLFNKNRGHAPYFLATPLTLTDVN